MPHRINAIFSLLFLGLLLTKTYPGRAQRVGAIGDYGYAGPAERDVANLIKGWNPDFIITLGDNNYDLGDSTTIDQNIGQYFHDYIYRYRGAYGPSASTNRFFPSLGNHDYYTANGEPYRVYFTLPGNGRYYDFVRGNVHFFVLNSDPAEPDGITVNSKQASWLRAALAGATAPWRVVYMHHAPYSSGKHGSTAALQWPYREWGASVVLAGHDHNYERLEVDKLPYFVNGLGGRSIYGFTGQPLAASQKHFNGDYGAMLLTASPDSLALQFYTRRHVLIDNYVLHRPLGTVPTLFPVNPNPFQEATTIEYSLPSAATVQLRVLNALGQEVAVLEQGPAAAGWHRLNWQRAALAAGLYYVQLVGNGFTQVTRAVVL